MNRFIDTRLVGTTAENIFLSLLNQKCIFAGRFDTADFDGIVYDMNNECFKVGSPPFYVQIKCRGAERQGVNPGVFGRIKKRARDLKIPLDSVYFVAGFYEEGDIRKVCYYIIPFESLKHFGKKKQRRFSRRTCEEVMEKDPSKVSKI